MKKFDKLRQWTDEKLGSSQRTVATEEFRDMETEINSRQQGLEAIHQASCVWMKALGKQKKSDGQESIKGTPIELLGIALFQHGEEFSSESSYGQSLLKFGIAQQKLARLQDVFQEHISGEVMLNMERSLATMKEYQVARKKLESRRLTYDSTLSKMQKVKKEDSKTEEEMRAARVRYEETNNDVEHRMMAIREGEANNLKDIEDFITAQADYYQESSNIMLQLKEQLGGLSSPSINRIKDIDVERPEHSSSKLLHVKQKLRSTSKRVTSSSEQRISNHARHALNAQDFSLSTSSLASNRELGSTLSAQDHITASSIGSAKEGRRSSCMLPLGHVSRKTLRAKFDFDAESPAELSLRRGDIISVIEEASSGWWTGQLVAEDGTIRSHPGSFPANYCSEHTLPSTQMPDHLQASPAASDSDDEQEAQISKRVHPPAPIKSNPRRQVSSMRGPPPPIPKKKQSMQQR